MSQATAEMRMGSGLVWFITPQGMYGPGMSLGALRRPNWTPRLPAPSLPLPLGDCRRAPV